MSQIKVGAILNYIILVLNTLVGLAYTPYLLRMLGQSEYGLYSLAASVIAYLTVLDCGFGNAIIRYTAKYRSEGKINQQYSLFGMFSIIYSIIGFIVLIVGIILFVNAERMFGNVLDAQEVNRARIIIFLMVANLAITFPLSIYGAIVTAYERFIFLRIVQITRIIMNTIVMIFLLNIGCKAVTLVVVQSIFNLLTLLINYLYCRKKICIRISFKKIEWGLLKEISIYSFWIFINIIIDRLYWTTGQFVLGMTSGTIAVSVYAVAIQLQALYTSFSSAVSGVFLPRITSMITNNATTKEISDLFIRIGRIQYIILSFILSGYIVFGKSFVRIWAGKEYEEAYIISLIFFVSLTVPLIQNVGIVILQARNQMKFRSIVYLIIALISLIVQIQIVKEYGGLGCAIGTSVSLIIGNGLIMNIYYKRKQKFDITSFWIQILQMSVIPFFTALFMIMVIDVSNYSTMYELLKGILLFSIIYMPLYWFFSLN